MLHKHSSVNNNQSHPCCERGHILWFRRGWCLPACLTAWLAGGRLSARPPRWLLQRAFPPPPQVLHELLLVLLDNFLECIFCSVNIVSDLICPSARAKGSPVGGLVSRRVDRVKGDHLKNPQWQRVNLRWRWCRAAWSLRQASYLSAPSADKALSPWTGLLRPPLTGSV